MILQAMLYYGFPFHQDDAPIDSIVEAWRKEKAPQRPKREELDPAKAFDIGIEYSNEFTKWAATTENVEIKWVGVGNNSNKLIVYVPCLTYYASEGNSSKLYLDIANSHTVQLKLAQADFYIKEFCEKAKLPFRQPGWHLTARYC